VRERDSLVASTSGRAVRPPGRRCPRGVHRYVTLTEVEPASDRLPSWGCDKGKPGESRRRKATRLPSTHPSAWATPVEPPNRRRRFHAYGDGCSGSPVCSRVCARFGGRLTHARIQQRNRTFRVQHCIRRAKPSGHLRQAGAVDGVDRIGHDHDGRPGLERVNQMGILQSSHRHRVRRGDGEARGRRQRPDLGDRGHGDRRRGGHLQSESRACRHRAGDAEHGLAYARSVHAAHGSRARLPGEPVDRSADQLDVLEHEHRHGVL
jgi:hypothetical protein